MRAWPERASRVFFRCAYEAAIWGFARGAAIRRDVVDLEEGGASPSNGEDVRIALVVGSTGLVGRELVHQLLDDPNYDRVRTFSRRSLGVVHERLEEHLVDFEDVSAFGHLLRGDVLFSCLGTTLRAAGSKAAQYRIDHDYQLHVAQAAAGEGTPGYVLVSSTGAGERSLVFYSRMKGELEQNLRQVPFVSQRYLRPGILDGARAEERAFEKLGLWVARLVPPWQGLAGLRAMPISTLARAMRQVAADWTPGVEVVEADRIFLLGAED